MRPITDRLLRTTFIVTAIAGQLLLTSNQSLGIYLLGVALAVELIDGWWYLRSNRSNWFPALSAVVGLTMWREPQGWFFMAWALINVGTGLRAESIFRSVRQAIAVEEARQARLAALTGDGEADTSSAPAEPDPESSTEEQGSGH